MPNTKPQGWFSRRHQTREAHDAAREKYRTRRDGRPKQTWDGLSKSWIKAAS